MINRWDTGPDEVTRMAVSSVSDSALGERHLNIIRLDDFGGNHPVRELAARVATAIASFLRMRRSFTLSQMDPRGGDREPVVFATRRASAPARDPATN